jgi:hypothetical protein
MEIWKIIPSAPDYSASNLGRIKRTTPDKCGRPMKVLAQSTKIYGHKQVSICRNTKIKAEVVHRLIAEAFLEPPKDESAIVCHKDGNPANNVPDNLYWGDAKTNGADAIAHGTIARGERNCNAKLTADIIRNIRSDGRSSTIAAPEYGVAVSTFCRIRKGQAWRHVV